MDCLLGSLCVNWYSDSRGGCMRMFSCESRLSPQSTDSLAHILSSACAYSTGHSMVRQRLFHTSTSNTRRSTGRVLTIVYCIALLRRGATETPAAVTLQRAAKSTGLVLSSTTAWGSERVGLRFD